VLAHADQAQTVSVIIPKRYILRAGLTAMIGEGGRAARSVHPILADIGKPSYGSRQVFTRLLARPLASNF
jgi:hypothetical protein